MDRVVEERLDGLAARRTDGTLAGGRIGLEKESLRVTPEGRIAQTPHPAGLGSALTHPYITTDFSEALIELITPPFPSTGETLSFLDRVHRFVYRHLADEILWATSMPCRVGDDTTIPIARYGTSNVGQMKHVYRRGLSLRYGRVMQTISGVHFNYSPPETIWDALAELDGDTRPAIERVSDGFFALIRNFQRLGWVISYLFGASPAVCKSFLKHGTGSLVELDRGTWHLPWATSLRMSDIGYKNSNQAGLAVSYDGLEPYVTSLGRAIATPLAAYEALGVKVDGEYRQLNANVLQIENEYYSFIRPKQITRSGERPTLALRRRGVQYVEVRALDVNAFEPLGVGDAQMRFIEALLLLCLLRPSPRIDATEQTCIEHNQRTVASRGREPGLRLRVPGGERPLAEWVGALLDALDPICTVLDAAEPGAHRPYARALSLQREAVADPERLPSARVIAELRANGESFFDFAMRRSLEHRAALGDDGLSGEEVAAFTTQAERSLDEQREIEASDQTSLDEYLRRYFAQATDERPELLA
ncbi:MAG: glutamate--cysteine ligase [Ectothiorhodospiraceae bacterium]|nr:glutamate--cysteine ligase [Ectothiorhodospiraceae bacterium]